MSEAKKHAGAASGVSNPTYDAMTVLTNKLQGIAAIEQYKQDAQGDDELLQCFEEIQQGDRDDVDRLRGLVAMRLQRELARSGTSSPSARVFNVLLPGSCVAPEGGHCCRWTVAKHACRSHKSSATADRVPGLEMTGGGMALPCGSFVPRSP